MDSSLIKAELLWRILWPDSSLVSRSAASASPPSSCFLDMESMVSEFFKRTPNDLDNLIKLFRGNPLELLPFSSLPNILIRDSYRDLYKRLEEFDDSRVKGYKRDNMHRAAIVTGQPGIGKTFSLDFILFMRLRQGKAAVVQLPGDHDYKTRHILFDEVGVRFVDGSSECWEARLNPDTWVLCDQKPGGVADEIEKVGSHRWFIVIASSPRYENFSKYKKHYNAPEYFMPAWTWDEICSACSLQHIKYDLSNEWLEILKELYRDYGPIPRILFQLVSRVDFTQTPQKVNGEWVSPIQLARSLEEYESRLDEKIRQFFSDSLSDFAKLQWSMEDDSPTVIMISPKDPLPGQLVSQLSSIGVVSPYVGKKMGELAVGEYISGAKRLYDTLYTLPNCQESAGYLFKARCHLCFTAGRYHFTPRILQPPSPRNPMSTIFNMKMDVPPQLSRNFKNIDDLTSILRGKPASAKYYHLTTNVYSQPYRSNLPAIDAIMIYRPSPHSQPRVVMLHYTLSYNHPLSGAGIQDVLNALPQELRKASQIKGNEPILLFAVPEEKKDHFQYQTTTNSNNELDNIIQMVVGMRSSTLWGGAVMNLFHTSRAILSSSPYLSRSGLRIVSGSSQLPSMCGRPNTMDVTALHLDLF